jgi:uncharacterized protein (TIGR00106 family)
MLVMFSIAPFGKGDSLSKYVVEAIKIIEKSGLPYQTNPMGTVIEGEWEDVFDVINKCRKQMRKHADRISIKIWVDDRKGIKNAMSRKIKSLEQKLGHELT